MPETFTRAEVTERFLQEAKQKLGVIKTMRHGHEVNPTEFDTETVDRVENTVVSELVSLSYFYQSFGFSLDDFQRDIVEPAKRETGVYPKR